MPSELISNWIEYLECTRNETWSLFIIPVQRILEEKTLDAPEKLEQLKNIDQEFLSRINEWYFNLDEV